MQRPKARSRYASFLRICRSFTLFTGLTVLLFLAACGGDNGGNTPSAQHLISQAQSAIQKVSSYHFNLTSDNLGTGSSDGFTVKTADGDILIPDKLQANANA
ncbi:MAG TPA: LppX_LprAFG lipoprotein, partial [Ktedonobacteraceae bacterium]|nr:LppX_LprAFG lipoprotein [Ktedonobacteraceae bacterium]